MRFTLTSFLLFSTLFVLAQPGSKRISRAEYIEMYKDDAIREMHRSGVPASITLAQGILESGDGNSPLARYANNHFGIKCHSDWKGPTFIQDDDEKDECFRKYKKVLDSYRDHSDFLMKKRYAFLFDLKITDYKGWAKGLKKAGYATNPKYPDLLIRIIEANNLDQYDRVKEGKLNTKKEPKVRNKDDQDNSGQSRRKGEHTVKQHENNIKYIELKAGDNIQKLADEFSMGEWQLYKYNDIEKGEELTAGQILFLQPKRGRAKQDYHTVKEGESMWDVSQQYGIKLKKLYRKNRMEKGEKVKAGQKLYLRKTKPAS